MLIFLSTCFILFMLVTLVLRLVLNIVFGRTRKKYSDAGSYQRGYHHEGKADGDVYVSSQNEQKEKVVGDDMGEYVDFEMVKEEEE